MNDKLIRSMGVSLICNFLLNKCCKEISTESAIYHQKLKRLSNQVIDLTQSTINKSRSLQTIQNASNLLQKDLDLEDIDDEIESNAAILELIWDIMLQTTPSKIFDLRMLLENVKNNRRLYTEEEMKLAIKNNLEFA